MLCAKLVLYLLYFDLVRVDNAPVLTARPHAQPLAELDHGQENG
jgi:hypothetical protein